MFSDAARQLRDPGHNNQAAMPRGEFLVPENNENPVTKGRKTLAL